ncbi:Retrovirus-related Pol polyprotein from transposon 412 [Vitis vinifera]|uniref:Retrovirus-related Pol polyprotein from transposon 412 n=1 Tax=Vitis vinifera TaxID=29760 RepID=A0A438GHR9_VITVI|nr:Retrovirus-related Pol polyprotein from transposon 412 [Vitis vinifera]
MLVDSTTGIQCCPSWMDFLNARATYQRVATTLFHDIMHRDVEFRLRLNPKKCTFGVTSGKLLGHIVSERGIEVDLEKIRAILDMPAPRTEREIRGFLSRLQYISRFIARLIDICEPIFLLLRKNQPIVWNDDCSALSRRLRSVSSLLQPVLTGRLMRWLVLLTEFDIHIAGWRLYFDGAANQSGFGIGILLISPQGDHIPKSVWLAFSDHYRLTNNIVEYEACITGLETTLDLGVKQLEIHGDSNLVIQQTQGIWRTWDEKLKPYHAYLDLLVDRLEFQVETRAQAMGTPFRKGRQFTLPNDQFRKDGDFQAINLPRVGISATLTSVIKIPAGVIVRPLLIETSSTKDRRALRQLTTRLMICGRVPVQTMARGLIIVMFRPCLCRSSDERDCCQFVQRCPKCQMHGDLIHVPPSELHALTSPLPFSVWGIDVIGKISPKSSSGHEVAKFIKSHIIYRYEVPHELISYKGVHFRGDVDTLIQEYGIQHHSSSAYRP